MARILGLDLGSYSLKAVVHDAALAWPGGIGFACGAPSWDCFTSSGSSRIFFHSSQV